jgi:hypothetical protein
MRAFVGARLAGEGDLEGAFAGKPGSYRFPQGRGKGDQAGISSVTTRPFSMRTSWSATSK